MSRLTSLFNRIRRSLVYRYAVLMTLGIWCLLVIIAAVEIRQAWLENTERAERLLAERAEGISGRINAQLQSLESQVRRVATLPWSSIKQLEADREFEYQRLLSSLPAVSEVLAIDDQGQPTLRVSKTNIAERGASVVCDPACPLRAGDASIHYGNAMFRQRLEPFAWLVVAERPGKIPGTAVLIDMKFLSEVMASAAFEKSGQAYVVDGAGQLIAHRDVRLLLRRPDLSGFPELLDLRRNLEQVRSVSSFNNPSALVVARNLGTTGWTLYVEQSWQEVMAPVQRTAMRTAAYMFAGMLLAVLLAITLARAWVKPIAELSRAAVRLGQGERTARAVVQSEDEIGELARSFNEMADKVQSASENLEGQVMERTLELRSALARVAAQAQELSEINQQLEQRAEEAQSQRTKADRASAAKTRLLAAASHDLRQPLHAISLLVGLLNERAAGSSLQGLVEKVQLSVRAMEGLFSSLLDISKLDAGVVKAKLRELPLQEVLRNLEQSYRPLAEEKGLVLRMVPTRMRVRSDAILLQQILGNLLSNAIRYTSKGKILVGCRRRGSQVEVLVLDSGIGIAPEHQQRIFEEFFQVANAERDRSLGLGLGLAIVERSALLLGHPLKLTSEVGRGTCFALFIERVEQPALPGQLALLSMPAEVSLQGSFVVLVEDDRESRLATESLLSHWGCLVLSARTAGEARQTLRDHLRSPDLIISDHRLPGGVSGLEAVAGMREQAEAMIPAILVSGDVLPELDAQARHIRLLAKPVDAATLRQAITLLLTEFNRQQREGSNAP